jgi:ATP-binding cassette subfamily B protein
VSLADRSPGWPALLWPTAQRRQARRALAMAAGLIAPGPPEGEEAEKGEAEKGEGEKGEGEKGEGEKRGKRVPSGGAIEIEAYDVWADAPPGALRDASPLLLEIPGAGWLALVRCGARNATVRGPRGMTRLRVSELEAHLWSAAGAVDHTARLALAADGVIDVLQPGASRSGTGRRPATRARIGRALLAPALYGRALATGERLRPAVGSLRHELRRTGTLSRAVWLPLGYAIQFALFVRVWSLAGGLLLADAGGVGGARGPALPPRFTELGGCLAAWVVVQLLTTASMSRLSLEAGGVIRTWLMRRMLRLHPERIRTAGLGDLLGRVLEAETLDVLALGGGVQTVAGLFELATGIIVMMLGGLTILPALSASLGIAALAVVGTVYARRFASWAAQHRELTHDLIERMCGHATVLVQDCAARRAVSDERDVGQYAALARRMDRAETVLTVVLPRLWLLATLATVGWAAAVGGLSAGAVATSLGGIWLFYSGLRRGADALPVVIAVRQAWQRMAPLIATDQAAEDAAIVEGNLALARASAAGVQDLASPEVVRGALAAQGVSFQFPHRPVAVLRDVELAIGAGDRILIQGSSGGGKSTLAALLTGLQTPTTGELYLDGLSQGAMGLSRWRHRVGAVPQFHDNHMMSADLLFNLLMGRRWPPRLADVAAAEKVCHALGLGPLLARMPGGLQQQVGETGWQLSHGEQSRIFLARSLLQPLDVRVLDETFAALDADTLDEVMRVVLAAPATLLVVAHP